MLHRGVVARGDFGRVYVMSVELSQQSADADAGRPRAGRMLQWNPSASNC